MRNNWKILSIALLAFSLGWAAKPDDAAAELLKLHQKDLQAHLKTDATLLSPSADRFVTVANGKINRVSPEEQRKFFTEYFRGANYPEYVDLEPPIVAVSDDGSLGYVISRIKAHRQQADASGKVREGKFVYAGIMVYGKKDGRYVRLANVSTFEPPPKSQQ